MRYRNRVRSFARACLLVIIILTAVLPAAPISVAQAATTRLVSKSGTDSGDCAVAACLTIGYAITQAVAGDTISIGAGTYAESVNIAKNLSLTGVVADTTIISGRVVILGTPTSAMISHLTIANPLPVPASGGAIFSEGTLTLNESVVRESRTDGAGGGIYSNGTLTLNNTQVIDNQALGHGGGIFIDSAGRLNLNTTHVTGNSAAGDGGGIDARGPATIVGSEIISNTAARGGGLNVRTVTELRDSLISDNEATSQGGGGINNISGGTMTIRNSILHNNRAVQGGGIVNAGTLMIIENSFITGNNTLDGGAAEKTGGGIRNGGILTLRNSTISDNSAGTRGGGIFNVQPGHVSLEDSTIASNTAIGYAGGGIFNDRGTIALNGSRVISNTLAGGSGLQSGGGGIYSRGGILTLINNSSVSHNTITALGGVHGGGIYLITSTLTMTDTTISGNSAALEGGGIFAYTSTLTLNTSTISNNIAGGAGGGIDVFVGSRATLINSMVVNNRASAFGGGIYNDVGTMTLIGSTVTSNTASGPGGGGGIYNNGDSTLTNSTVSGNIASQGSGGGIHNIASSTLRCDNCTVSGNRASGSGGGIASSSISVASLTNSKVISNTAAGAGGGIYNTAILDLNHHTIIAKNESGGPGGGISSNNHLTVSDSQIIANVSPSSGGGIHNMGTLTVTNSLISANQLGNSIDDGIRGGAREMGGGIHSTSGSTLVLKDTTISGHEVGGDPDHSDGGGLNLSGVVAVLTNVFVSGNHALGNGGGIYAQDTALTITGSTISGNSLVRSSNMLTSTSEGGGIHVNRSGAITITNSTISGNHSDNIAGGIFWQGTNITTALDHVTITDNTAVQGGGIWRSEPAATVQVRGSIIAENRSSKVPNTFDTDCQGGLTSRGGNLFGIGGECSPVRSLGDQYGTEANPLDPGIGPLRPNGGYAPMHALLTGSPAMDAAGPCSAPDQRGVPRPQGASCDIGAYEAGPATRLIFSGAVPRSSVEGEPFATPFTVIAVDTMNNIASLTRNLTLMLDPATNPAQAALSGTVNISMRHGVAVFDNIAITKAGNGFRLRVVSPGLDDALSPPLEVLADTLPPLKPGDPYEPNNDILEAVPIVFDSYYTASYSATIASTNDIDVFKLVAQPSSIITITLDQLPADYDLVLLRDPRDVTDELTGTLDISSLIALQRDTTPRGMVPRGMVPRGMVPLNIVPENVSLDSLVVDAGANPGTANEHLTLPLPLGGTYYIAVLSTHHEYSEEQYHLGIKLQPGDLKLPSVVARQPSELKLPVRADVQTIYLTNFARMEQRYAAPEESTTQISTLLISGTMLISESHGLVLNLPDALHQADLDHLNALYNQWDDAQDQPLFANEVVNQIQRILGFAIKNYYAGTTNIVLIGGDDVLPFARVPDENAYGNEQDYYYAIRGEASTPSATGTLSITSPLAASLWHGFMQTDDVYASRRRITYRGRQLALPDLGVGRLVERPSDIARYLRAYQSPSSLVVRADSETGGSPAFVTGYDFLKDQAGEITTTLKMLGLDNRTELVNDRWTTDQLEGRWFSGQLPRLTSAYTPTAIGISTRFALVSLNGHFSHYAAQSAATTRADRDFTAQRVLTPTVASDLEPYAFFKRWRSGQESATLLYSIGCHSGLSAPDSAFEGPQAAHYAADFASAVIKQGGNWIGNTGYGYADTQVVGYSEQLAVFFTHALGRDEGIDENYVPTTIGEALTRAKQRYVREQGVGGFSVADEKVITGWTLYGLPFIRVRVPTPYRDKALPAATLPAHPDGTFTRIITITSKWLKEDIALDRAVQVTLTDSLATDGTRIITGTPQGNWGAPVLPVLSIPLSVPSRAGQALPELRGVRLLGASSDLQPGYAPRVASPITDTDSASQPRDLSLLNLWTPDLTYGAFRTTIDDTGAAPQPRDVLMVHPAQFRSTGPRFGELRRFTRMVLELTYVDPSMPSTARDDRLAPVITDLAMTDNGFISGHGTYPITFTTIISAEQVTIRQAAKQPEPASVSGIREIRVVYTADGKTWGHVVLSSKGHMYQATVLVALQGQGLFAYIQAVDRAGNVTIRVVDRTTLRLYLSAIHMQSISSSIAYQYLPIVKHK
jgi:predicted outer membrane repeat protein